MLECHVYPLDREGKIVGRADLMAPDAAAAMRMAREHFPDVALESMVRHARCRKT
jgi:hypothetical protein